MKPFEFGYWHAWEGVRGILLSNESTKTLHQFDTPTGCINWLWLNNHKDASRALNDHVKAS